MCAALGVLAAAPSAWSQSPAPAEPPAVVVNDEVDEPANAAPLPSVSTGNRHYDRLLSARSHLLPAAASAASSAAAGAAEGAALSQRPAADAAGEAAAPASLRDALLREGAEFAQRQREAQAAREAATTPAIDRGGAPPPALAGAAPTHVAEVDGGFDLRALLRTLQTHRYEVLAVLVLVLLLALGLSARHNRRQRRRAREAARRTVTWPGAQPQRSGRQRHGRHRTGRR